MLILGLNSAFRAGYQEASACLVRDGRAVCAIEEERLNRIKRSPGQMAEKSIERILEREKIQMRDIDFAATHGITFGPEFESCLKSWLKFRFGHAPRILRFHHHLAHAASAYYGSGFDKAMILTADSSGDGISLQTAIAQNGRIKTLKQYKRPQSLGLFYSMMTQFCGFQRDSDEYKLMGLSAYGRPVYDLSFLLSVKGGDFNLNADYLAEIKPGQSQPHKQLPLFSYRLAKALKLEPREPAQPITDDYKNLSASAQLWFEKALIGLVSDLYKQTKAKKLCLAGGAALNCLANQKLAQLDFIEDVYVQPASSDAGISLGAAWLAGWEMGDKPRPPGHSYLGPSYSDEEIFKELKASGAPFKELTDPEIAAKKILKGDVVGWFQGAMEFGPRALGNRSVLANPFDKSAKGRVNSKVKFREEFRPFGPSLLIEDKARLLDSPLKEMPYMTVTANVKKEWRGRLSSITHRDGTTRPQTVSQANNPLYWRLLRAIKKEKGAGILLNTSFNQSHEPIVNRPKEALASFFSSGMDGLFIGSFFVKKGA